MKIDETILAKLIYAARKRKGFTQSYVSKETSITQGTLSKIETGLCSVSAKHWFLLSKLLDIPSDAVWTGVIDRGVRPSRESEKNTFKLPKKYFTNAHSSVKEIIPILEYVAQDIGQEQVDNYLKQIGINEHYFYDLNNTINFSFAADLLSHFYLDSLDENLYEKIAKLAKNDKHHGIHANEYRKKNTALNLLKNYVDNSHFYQSAYKYKVTERGHDSLEFVMESQENGLEEVEDILIPFKKSYMEHLTRMDDNSSISLSVSKKDGLITFKAQSKLS